MTGIFDTYTVILVLTESIFMYSEIVLFMESWKAIMTWNVNSFYQVQSKILHGPPRELVDL